MGGIHRPSQGLRHLQPCITHRHTGKISRTPKNIISNQTHVLQKQIQAHHRQDWDIHWLQSGCQARRKHGTGTISVPNDGIFQDTRIQVDGLGLSKAQFARKDNSPRPTRKLVSYRPVTFSYRTILDLIYMLHVDDGTFVFLIQDRHRKRDHPPLQPMFLIWPRNTHWHRKKIS